MICSMLISEPQRCWLPLFQVVTLLQAKLTGSWVLLHIPKVASALLSDCFHARKQISILPKGIPSTRWKFCSLIPLKWWYISLFKHGDMALQSRIWFPIRTMALITSSSKMQVLLSASADNFQRSFKSASKKERSVNRSSSFFFRDLKCLMHDVQSAVSLCQWTSRLQQWMVSQTLFHFTGSATLDNICVTYWYCSH